MTIDPGQERHQYGSENPAFVWMLLMAYSKAYATVKASAAELDNNLIGIHAHTIAVASAEGRLMRDLRTLCGDYGVPFDSRWRAGEDRSPL